MVHRPHPNDDGTVSIARVTAGDTFKGLRVISEGLKPGARVVVEGIQLVRPGQKTKPQPFESPALADVIAAGKKARAEPERPAAGPAPGSGSK